MKLMGCELDDAAVQQALTGGLSKADMARVEIRDFVLDPPQRRFSIVANPPYIRHHRLGEKLKDKLRAIAKLTIGRPLDGRAGYHIYFLLQGLQRLAPGGRLSFIMPADTCEGVFSHVLWKWITTHYCLEHFYFKYLHIQRRRNNLRTRF